MFSIKISDQSRYKDESQPYVIRYELIPDITKGVNNKIIHESRFTNCKKAEKVASDLSNFLDESFHFLELIYTKLKQLELAVITDKKYLLLDFNEIENARIYLIQTRVKQREAHDHITSLRRFLNLLKQWCFNIKKCYRDLANSTFQMLLSFELHFKNSYRSAKLLSETDSLKLFL